MAFIDKYIMLCERENIKPYAQSTADKFNIQRSTICGWAKKGIYPKSEQIKQLADLFSVSADYLLDRTTDPTDYAKMNIMPKSFRELDEIDQIRVEAFISGLLSADKYKENR